MSDKPNHIKEVKLDPNRKLYFWMIVGNVVVKEGDNAVGVMVNALVMTEDETLGVHILGKSQQALQAALWTKLKETKEVVDVVILGFIPLGRMTTAEFNRMPPDVAVQERKQPIQQEPKEDIDPNNPFGDEPQLPSEDTVSPVEAND